MFSKSPPRKPTHPRPLDGEPRRPGRPRGTTAQGEETRALLYKTAVKLIGRRGYDATTMRDIANEAGVSPGLLYRYFPSKRAVVLALYDELSSSFAERAGELPGTTWRERFTYALRESLAVLAKKRAALASLTPVLVGDAEDGLFAPATSFSRQRVQAVFEEVVRGACDAPPEDDALALGHLLYFVHLMVVLGWLLDRSDRQAATHELVGMLERALPFVALALHTDVARMAVRRADALLGRALLGD